MLFSDKRVKGIAKEAKKKAGKAPKPEKSGKKPRKTNGRKPRYFVPLMFNAHDGKTVIRRMKVLDMRDDKKYEDVKFNDWVRVYGKMLLFILSDHSTQSFPIFEVNPDFDFNLFMLCGGITNTRFWDINLRYAEEAAGQLGEAESHSIILGHISRQIAYKWAPEYKRIERTYEDKKVAVTEDVQKQGE